MGPLAIWGGTVLGAVAATGPQPPKAGAEGTTPYDDFSADVFYRNTEIVLHPLLFRPNGHESALDRLLALKQSFIPTLLGTSKFRVFK
ncbi:MAG: hypothetical protein HY696_08575 [Deltaproteobacteria bacterium]|nr:hypothetical protein [Deltaproteobacteria bacterium]